jgi:hypothetical protein
MHQRRGAQFQPPIGVARVRRHGTSVLYVKAAARGYLYRIFMPPPGSMHATMDDLWFVGLTVFLALLTWLGALLCERLLKKS